MRNLSRTIALLLFLFFSFSVQAGNSPLLIVEIQIAGEKTSDDFIKIYNPTDSDIYLANYRDSYFRLVKRTKTGAKDILIKSWSKEPEAKVLAGKYYLWANSKDKNYPAQVRADAFSVQYLADNNGIALRLGSLDSGEIIDAVGWGDFNNLLFEGSPFPENPGSNQKLERKKINGVYQDTNNNASDFYLSPLSEPELKTPLQNETKSEPQLEPQSESSPELLEEVKPLIHPSGVVINEILANTPLGIRDEEGEYIEIFNQNNFEVDLSGWKIEDILGKTTTYIFPQGTKILAQKFLVFYRPTTKIILNNDSDGLNLIQPDGKIIDRVNYEKAPRGQSYNRTITGWAWSPILTPGSENVIAAQETKKIEFVEDGEKSVKKTESLDKELAAAAQSLGQGYLRAKIPKTLSVFLIALALAIFSGIIILSLKKRLKIR